MRARGRGSGGGRLLKGLDGRGVEAPLVLDHLLGFVGIILGARRRLHARRSLAGCFRESTPLLPNILDGRLVGVAVLVEAVEFIIGLLVGTQLLERGGEAPRLRHPDARTISSGSGLGAPQT